MGSPLRTVGLAFACLALTAPATAQDTADRIWTGGTILTMNDKAPRAQAVAERGGRIVAGGTRADVLKLRGPNTQVIDLAGRALLPGFFDAHGHVTLGGLQALSANLLAPPDGKVTDIPALLQTLRDWIAANEAAVKKVNLIVGFGYDNSTLAERRHPTRDDLDSVSRDVPILLVHQSAHLAALNSKALEVVGYTSDTPDPAGGVIRRKAGGREPDGVLEETAMQAAALKLLGQVGADGVKTFFKAGTELWARYGYTTAQDGGSTPGSVAAMRQVAAAGELKIDVTSYPLLAIDRDFVKANASREYANRFRVAGGKIVIDGSPQGFTAWRDRPYYKPVGNYPSGYSGYPSAMPEDVVSLLTWAYANDVQVQTHANGEAASDALIAGLTVAQLKHGGKNLRPVLIHGQFMREDQVDAYQRLNVFPSLFPMHTFYWGEWHLNQTVGPERGRNISPTGWVRQRGMIFSTHHDAPVAFPDSMRVLDATVTRRARGTGRVVGPHQRVDVMTALKAMTIWPAYQHFEEERKGSIEVGKLADFVILSADPTKVAPTSLAQLKVTATIKEGATIFALDAREQRKAALMPRPGIAGDDAFARAIRTLAVYREYERLPVFMQTPVVMRHLAAMPHSNACTGAAIGELVAAMLAGSGERSDEPAQAPRTSVH
jgi:predicted amidohydrolase YtcJ